MDLNDDIKKKMQRLEEIFSVMKVYMDKPISKEEKQEAENEQFLLEKRLKELELKGLDEKIRSYEKVTDILKCSGKK